MKTLNVRITGTTPLLMHSSRGSNPLDPMTKAHKELTSKRKKTDDDHEAIARSEWRLGLYWSEGIGPYIPLMNVRASLVSGAKFNKLGASVKRSTVMTEMSAPLEYKGPRDPDAMFADGRFIDCQSVKVGQSRLMRTRPVFPEWALQCELAYDEEQIERDQLVLAFENAGRLIGLGDFRAECGGTFGRYRVDVD